MDGKGVFTWKDGRRYEGEYKEDKKDGFGIYIAKGKKYEGGWKDGHQHGEGTISTAGNDEVKKGIWHEGKRIKWVDG